MSITQLKSQHNHEKNRPANTRVWINTKNKRIGLTGLDFLRHWGAGENYNIR